MIAILLGVGLFQIFAGIGHLLQVRHRVKPYWLHSLWVLILIMAHAHLWWSFLGPSRRSHVDLRRVSLSVDRPRRFGDHESSHYSRRILWRASRPEIRS